MDALTAEDPRTLGAYRLLGRLGAGGMGRVYLARSDRGRTVAVKLVHPELAGQDEFRRRFRREVRAAREVGGEWTAPVLDADTEADVPWVATGYIAGPSLRQVVGQDFGPLPERSVRILAAGLARALQAIHAAGLVHRDLKPSNVLVTLDGPRVIDFGIARALDALTDGEGLTRTGAAVGSPGFMSPEQVRGRGTTAASDVFCLGSVLAYAATGRMPFGTADSGAHALMFRVAEEEPDLTDVPGPLLPLITDCLAKEPADRPTPEQVLDRLDRTDADEEPASAAEPWLPGGLVAQLGRHAARMLDVEGPAEISGTAPAAASEQPASVVPPPVAPPPADPPTMTAVTTSVGHPPPPPGGYGPAHPGPYTAPYGPYGAHPHGPYYGPQQPPARRSRKPLAIVAIATAGLLAGAGTVYLVKQQRSGDDDRPSAHPTTADRSPGHNASSPPRTPRTPRTPPTTVPPTGAAPTGGAQAFNGSWSSDFATGGGRSYRTIDLTVGASGGTAEIEGHGNLDDGTSYRCTWTAPVRGDSTATVLRLGPSTVTGAQPASACQPGSASDLTLLPDGRMRRDFVDSGTKDASLVYGKQG
ncbi:serine/threonine protein kinase [Streptomyces sp. AV19]|uniref:serine/threonine-protein kinase n=1 Tax=Streptomyces sp. AV19 TaxID=2793068 RepID=UPI0018FE5511|nr:serine/threonine-protein kinase [Streptomyces sp. AV19]MBH1934599.1 serine/threonine protein kinase [Streptomyces sp. AV19]MDG4530863.1 serine/threonine protein kinase [Streptomyces sp. AV19]